MRRARTWHEAQRRLDRMSLLRAIALSAAVWVAILFVALAVTGCGQATGTPSPAAQVSAAP
jgi:hypothetical protein